MGSILLGFVMIGFGISALAARDGKEAALYFIAAAIFHLASKIP